MANREMPFKYFQKGVRGKIISSFSTVVLPLSKISILDIPRQSKAPTTRIPQKLVKALVKNAFPPNPRPPTAPHLWPTGFGIVSVNCWEPLLVKACVWHE